MLINDDTYDFTSDESAKDDVRTCYTVATGGGAGD